MTVVDPESDDAVRAVRAAPRSVRVLVGATAVVVASLYLVADRLIEDVLVIEAWWGQLLEVVVMAVLTSVALWIGVLRPLHRRTLAESAIATERQSDLARRASHQEFESKLHRALDMAATEESAYAITTKALAVALNGLDAELLLADSSDAHLKRALTVHDGIALCDVISPHECPAIRRSQSLRFASSSELDACPHLDRRPSGPCSAACVPLSVGGRSIGVLHTVGADGTPPSSEQIERLETVATHAGARIGMLRVMASTSLQAATDPLTGLLNRRSFENQTHALLRRGQPFALAMGDLDLFKRLNDTHGHDAGDRALRLFANVLRTSLRDDDLISRYGGEEFVIVCPDQTAEQAATALRRMQSALLTALADGTVAVFTVSYGVTDSYQAASLEELCSIADAALFRAKRDGRDRVITDPDPAERTPHLAST